MIVVQFEAASFSEIRRHLVSSSEITVIKKTADSSVLKGAFENVNQLTGLFIKTLIHYLPLIFKRCTELLI